MKKLIEEYNHCIQSGDVSKADIFSDLETLRRALAFMTIEQTDAQIDEFIKTVYARYLKPSLGIGLIKDDIEEFVVGFGFTDNQVTLIEKKRPNWQSGLLNGVGGRVEKDEGFVQAMRREFLEETGVDHQEWKLTAVMTHSDRIIYVLCASSPVFKQVKSQTDEIVGLFDISEIVTQSDSSQLLIHNLPALITLCGAGNHEKFKCKPLFILHYAV